MYFEWNQLKILLLFFCTFLCPCFCLRFASFFPVLSIKVEVTTVELSQPFMKTETDGFQTGTNNLQKSILFPPPGFLILIIFHPLQFSIIHPLNSTTLETKMEFLLPPFTTLHQELCQERFFCYFLYPTFLVLIDPFFLGIASPKCILFSFLRTGIKSKKTKNIFVYKKVCVHAQSRVIQGMTYTDFL